MRPFGIKILVTIVGVIFQVQSVIADSWQPSMEISDRNAAVSFEVDSTWHLIHGKISGLNGKVWFAQSNGSKILKAELNAPVAQFNTENRSRDSELKKVMAEPEYPKVTLTIESAEDVCTPEIVKKSGSCTGILSGKLTIRDVTKDIQIPYKVVNEDGVFKASGEFQLKWADYGVEDPSILIAKLHDTVKVSFWTKLNTISG